VATREERPDGMPAEGLHERNELRCICAWCKRAELGGVWVLAFGGEPISSATPTHGICPVCVLKVLDEISNDFASRVPCNSVIDTSEIGK
jgi:hypothetical protein